MAAAALRVGGMYRFRYKCQAENGHTVERECVGKFLQREGDKLFVSFRPLAGTSEFYFSQIHRIEQEADSTKPLLPRKPVTP